MFVVLMLLSLLPTAMALVTINMQIPDIELGGGVVMGSFQNATLISSSEGTTFISEAPIPKFFNNRYSFIGNIHSGVPDILVFPRGLNYASYIIQVDVNNEDGLTIDIDCNGGSAGIHGTIYCKDIPLSCGVSNYVSATVNVCLAQ